MWSPVQFSGGCILSELAAIFIKLRQLTDNTLHKKGFAPDSANQLYLSQTLVLHSGKYSFSSSCSVVRREDQCA